ncbi:MAG TPA: peptidylprolyl isomerase [Candidatus Diapherotrites archaeon]|uniref:Peptidyl-prolyl cis-trans isomerase n=1 Tax=Candidatus Iainarchaeum sp. TaxID=3101447 RepID=A0A7J4IU59_9ARCH|nr:peptidylprolyl isomerase [Candidatus Diapherotrites archaeon]
MKISIVALALGSLLLLAGCSQQDGAGDGNNTIGGQNSGADKVAVEKGDTIKVEYSGSFPDGTIFDKSEGRGPLEFVAGQGNMIKGFDEAVIGMKLNEEKNVTIPPEKAYGSADDGQVTTVPLSQISGDGNITVGSVLSTSTGQQATVTDINNGIATVKITHPLAGKTLRFWIKVISIQKPQN